MSVVLFSGGLDSTVALFWASRLRSSPVVALMIDYGQRNSNELGWGRYIIKNFLPDVFVDEVKIPNVLRGESSLLNRNISVDKYADADAEAAKTKRDNASVPLRNGVFLSIAANHALALGHNLIVHGMRAGSDSDCTADFSSSLAMAFTIGSDLGPISIVPLLSDVSRADTIRMAIEMQCMGALAYSMTCFEGTLPPCGHCHSCIQRAQGFAEVGVQDPLLVRLENA